MEYILITGVSTGIGLSIAKYFHKEGFYVFGSVRKATDARQLEQQFSERFQALIFDVCDQEAINKSVDIVAKVCGDSRLSCLVNNAGIAINGPLEHIPIEEIQYQLEVNVLGVMRVTQAFLKLMGNQIPKPQNPGKIFNIGSVSGIFAAPFLGPYCMSKYALEALSDSLRRELMIYGIQVILIQPGPIKTPIWDKAKSSKKKEWDNTNYSFILKDFDKTIAQSEKAAIDAKVVAQTIFKAFRKANPKTRYIVMKGALMMKIFGYFVPDKVADYFVRKNFQKLQNKKMQDQLN